MAVQLFTFILCSNYCLLINLSITYNLLVNLIYIMKNYFILFALSVWMTGLSTNAHGREIPDFFWMKKVGAMSYPVQQAVYNVTDYGAKGDALSMNTTAIQKAIDAAEQAGGGTVVFHPGIYLTGSLFVGNNVNLHISKGVTLIGSQDIGDYKKIDTRVAGIEMEWPSALINIIGKKNAAISGDGVINGRGKVFWDKYWNMRKDYEAKGLRWIVDYDCERPRGILIAECENVTVRDIVLYQPGFWSLHILYSKHITIDGIIISNNIEGHGPSTDGIDIDSSEYILVQNANINCNDDNFCLKAGRDSDGLRVNRPCQYVVIRDCVAGSGGGKFRNTICRIPIQINNKRPFNPYHLDVIQINVFNHSTTLTSTLETQSTFCTYTFHSVCHYITNSPRGFTTTSKHPPS